VNGSEEPKSARSESRFSGPLARTCLQKKRRAGQCITVDRPVDGETYNPNLKDQGVTMADDAIRVRLTQRNDYQFEARFADGAPPLLSDEPAPMGQSAGPSPVELLASAVGTCLSNSLLFALRKFKQQPEPLQCEVEAVVGRNAEGRMRVQTLSAKLTLGVAAASLERLDRVLDQFESYCTVTQSVRRAIPVTVSVYDALGEQLK
jgi:uncharacterized OsmC-like protein